MVQVRVQCQGKGREGHMPAGLRLRLAFSLAYVLQNFFAQVPVVVMCIAGNVQDK